MTDRPAPEAKDDEMTHWDNDAILTPMNDAILMPDNGVAWPEHG